MKWVEALKIYNQGKSWTIPKKGTKEYLKVKKIMSTSGAGVCSDNPRYTDEQKDSAGVCFKKGMSTGINIQKRREAKRREEEAEREANRRPDIENMTLRELGTVARKYKVKNYSQMNKQTLLGILQEILGEPDEEKEEDEED